MIKEISHNIQLIDKKLFSYGTKSDLADMFSKVINRGLTWPSEEFIKANMIENSRIKSFREEVVTFISHVFIENWIADGLSSRLIAVRGGMNQYDCFLCRYEKDGYFIQIAVKKREMDVVLASATKDSPFADGDYLKNVLTCMELFLKNSEQLKGISWKVVEFDNLAIGYHLKSAELKGWHRDLKWLTNGAAVCFQMDRVFMDKEEPVVEGRESLEEEMAWFTEITDFDAE